MLEPIIAKIFFKDFLCMSSFISQVVKDKGSLIKIHLEHT